MKIRTTLITTLGAAGIIGAMAGPVKAEDQENFVEQTVTEDSQIWQMAAHERMGEGEGMGRRMMDDDEEDEEAGPGMMQRGEGRHGKGMMGGDDDQGMMDRGRGHRGEGRRMGRHGMDKQGMRGHGRDGGRHMMAHHMMMHHMMKQHQKHHGNRHGQMAGKHGKGHDGKPGGRSIWGHKVSPTLAIGVEDVTAHLERRLERIGNKRLKFGNVTERGNTITADILTVDDSLVRRLSIDRATGKIEHVSVE